MYQSAHATLITNGDFSTSPIGTLGWIERTNADSGWYTSGGNWGIAGGQATATGGWMGQANTVGSETGNLLTLSFDWTPDGGATGEDLRLYYAVAGWFADGGSGPNDDFMNLSGTNLDAGGNPTFSGLTGVASVLDVQTGATFINSTHANTVVSESFVTGVAGVTQNFQIPFDMSGYAANVNDVSDLKYFGIRFHGNTGLTGTNILDNVAVSASVIPEPSTLALVAVGLVGLIGRRRRK